MVYNLAEQYYSRRVSTLEKGGEIKERGKNINTSLNPIFISLLTHLPSYIINSSLLYNVWYLLVAVVKGEISEALSGSSPPHQILRMAPSFSIQNKMIIPPIY
ncbi:hypothetical protein PanWU01x14_173410, partial [Parasponia andersonii]